MTRSHTVVESPKLWVLHMNLITLSGSVPHHKRLVNGSVSYLVRLVYLRLELDHVSTQRTQGGLNLNFQTHPYGVDFLNP